MNALGKALNHAVVQLEAEGKAVVAKDRYRLQFHLMPPVGWLNDPNGLCEFQGEYHVFFQYSPFDANGGLKCWGHYISRDLIHWRYVGVPLLPDQPFDCHGVYSGSALTEGDEMHLYYTGNVKLDGDYDYITSGRGAATILTSSRDGIHFGRKQCVIRDEDYPKDYTCHIRDPKVWKEDGQYYMVLGGRRLEGKGAVLLYQSKDLTDWNLIREYTTVEPFGYMWECPDLFLIEDTYVLGISPQGLKRGEYRYQNVYQSGYFLFNQDFITGEFVNEFKEWDMGFDFYAPQTFLDHKNRRILIGWIGMPDSEREYQNPTVEHHWQCALTVPREIKKKGQILCSYPVYEINSLRVDEKTFAGSLEVESGAYDLLMQDIQSEKVTLWIGEETCITYEEGIFSLRFTGDTGAGRTVRKAKVSHLDEIRILMDTSVLEIYINQGETVFTTRYYPKGDTLQIRTDHTKNTIWKMKSMTFTNSKE